MVDKSFLDSFLTKYPAFKDINLDEKTLFYKAISYIRENFNVSFTKIDNTIHLQSKNSKFKVYEVRKTEKYIMHIILKISSFNKIGDEQYYSFVYDPFSDNILNINIKNLRLSDSAKFEIKEEVLNIAVSKFLDKNPRIFDKYNDEMDIETEQEKANIKAYFQNLDKEMEEEEKKIDAKISELSEKLKNKNETKEFILFEKLYKERENLYSKLAVLKDENRKRREELNNKQQNILMKIDKNLKLKLEISGVLAIKYEEQYLNLLVERPEFLKFIVYNTLKDEHDLKCKCGKNVGVFIVTKKDEIICEDCAVRCDYCTQYLSKFDNYYTCKVCNKNLCEGCSNICLECGEYYCKDHISKCEVCNKPICDNCMHTCTICGMKLCKEHTHRCTICDREICKRHTGKCSICDREVCSVDFVYCERCSRKVCKDHARIDSLDNKYYCLDDVEECSYCGKYYSIKHIEHCEVCNIAICKNDAKHCDICNVSLCSEHVYKCAICGKKECKEHVYACKMCSEKVCKENIHNQICDMCANRKAVNEDFIVLEILKKYNLPKRGKWSKSKNKENIFYYHENKGLSIFKLVKNSGEISKIA
jgi:hypothetical protein